MCDKRHFDDLDERVDSLDKRLSIVESSLNDIKEDISSGFAKIEHQINSVYEEKSKWNAWAREHLGHCLKWAGWIILGACGINQSTEILHFFFK